MRFAHLTLTLLAPFLIVAAVLNVTPFEWHDQQRLGQLLVLTIMLLAVVVSPSPWAAAARLGWQGLAVAAFFAWGLLAVVFAPYALWAGLEWSLLAALFVLLLAVSVTVRCEPQLSARVAAWSIASFALLYAVKTFAALTAVYVGAVPLDTMALLDGFSNRRFLGQVMTLAWPLLVMFAVCAESPGRRRVLFAAAALSVYIALISQTRGTLYGLSIATGLLAVVARPGGGWWRMLLATLLAGVLIYVLLIFGPSWLFGWKGVEVHFGDGGLSGRDLLWTQAVRQIQAHPWFGLGPMGYVALRVIYGAHPHNSALQIAVEWGLPAALLAGGLIVLGMARFATILRQRPGNVMGSGLFLALTASLIQSLVDGVFVMPVSQLFLVSVAGASLAWCQLQAPAVGSDPALRGWIVRLIAAGVLTSLVVSLYLTLALPGNGFGDAGHCFSPTPRFWACGAISLR